MGPGRKGLGFGQGRRIERQPYDLLFGKRQAPDGTPLGRAPASGRKAAEVYKALLAAEPHATAERKRELRTQATRQARQGPLYFDLTLLFSKSISIFHASLGENARLARQAGDHDSDAYWSGLVAEVDDMIWTGRCISTRGRCVIAYFCAGLYIRNDRGYRHFSVVIRIAEAPCRLPLCAACPAVPGPAERARMASSATTPAWDPSREF